MTPEKLVKVWRQTVETLLPKDVEVIDFSRRADGSYEASLKFKDRNLYGSLRVDFDEALVASMRTQEQMAAWLRLKAVELDELVGHMRREVEKQIAESVEPR